MKSIPRKKRLNAMRPHFGSWQTRFYGMPYRKELSEQRTGGEKSWMIASRQCVQLLSAEKSAGVNSGESLRKGGKAMIRGTGRRGYGEMQEDIRDFGWAQLCGKFRTVPWRLSKTGFQKERQVLVWDNRMIESQACSGTSSFRRLSRIMDMVAEDLYDIITGRAGICRRS